MITRRPSAERGLTQIEWLRSLHTFSFNDYFDPDHHHFRNLRVINEDWVEPGVGFPTHGHRDMEIVTWILQGALAHQDSMGNGSTIRPGEAQRMSAGRGVLHSEMNPSESEGVHLLQIWITPLRKGDPPGYEQRSFAPPELEGRLRAIATPDGRDGSVTIHADASILVARLAKGGRATHRLAPGRHAWVQVARGALSVNGVALAEGDGAALSEEAAVELVASEACEAIVFDLA